ncbi:ComEA family DNA-binding protein [Actinoplanes sp. NPDC051851]|uniref:ComEA family DNA-binding protein n=1 Tax=Actinoplanes sp. NPDC051851 TaxID=3154753 RepID=UPI00343B3C22
MPAVDAAALYPRTPLAPPDWPGGGASAKEEGMGEGMGERYAWEFDGGAEPEEGPGLSGAGAFGGRGDGAAASGGRGWLRAFDPGRAGVRALAAVAVVVVLVAAFLAWRARPEVDPVAPVFGSTVSAAPAAVQSGAAGEVVVAVGGKVRRPGLVRLSPGARVADALAAAGGAEPGVDVAMLNLARRVADGELIMVGVTPSAGSGVVAPAVPAGTAGGALVNLNTAGAAELDTLPGVGPVLAQRILDARTAAGGFTAVSDLRQVDGIGDARYEQLKDLVTV